jgi:hypothetical protein
VQVHLERKPTPTDAEKMARLDHSIIRPFQPNFDPSISMKWMQAVESCVIENIDGTHHDRLQAAMIFASILILPKRKKKSEQWHVPRSNVLDPHVSWRNI